MDKRELLNKINDFNLLGENWDSYGAPAITVDTINFAREYKHSEKNRRTK